MNPVKREDQEQVPLGPIAIPENPNQARPPSLSPFLPYLPFSFSYDKFFWGLLGPDDGPAYTVTSPASL